MINFNKKIITVFFLSIASGLPFLLIVSTLGAWLFKHGISKTDIGILAWVSVPYVFKFIWAPFLDQYQLPILSRYLGHRRAWLLLSQVFLVISIICLALTDTTNLIMFGLWAAIVGFCSANQDINIEAYRLEILPKKEIDYGSSASVLGYRVGMLISGAGALYLSHFFSWSTVYLIMSGIVATGCIVTLCAPSPERVNAQRCFSLNKIVAPAYSLVKHTDVLLIILFIIFFKFSDTALNSMSLPFLFEIGFSELDIANVAKTFGISAMILGSVLGGWSLIKNGLKKSLYICIVCQLFASALLVLQSIVGNSLNLLFVSMFFENIATGIAQVTLISYLSSFCRHPYFGTHYAILSSFSSLIRIIFSTLAGWLADKFYWPEFYSIVFFSCIPTLFILYYFHEHFEPNDSIESEDLV